jgi:hypothetical protein
MQNKDNLLHLQREIAHWINICKGDYLIKFVNHLNRKDAQPVEFIFQAAAAFSCSAVFIDIALLPGLSAGGFKRKGL